MYKTKEYLTIEEQLRLLEDKGLKFKSEKLAKKYLNDIGYYKLINGYKFPFLVFEQDENGKVNHKFREGTTIDDLYQLYKFDQDLKSLIFKNISYIEVMIKARMSDFISQNYGVKENEYLQSTNFKSDSNNPNQKKFIELHSDILKSINEQYGKHDSITWYANHYKHYPFWVVSNILTLGTISLLYSKMKQPDQYSISKTFGVKSKLFESMLMLLLLFRNKCAHNEIVYSFKTKCSLSQKDLKNIYELYDIPINRLTGRYMCGVNDILGLIIVFKYLLDSSQFLEFVAQFKSLLNNLSKKLNKDIYKNILKSMGVNVDLELIKKYKKED